MLTSHKSENDEGRSNDDGNERREKASVSQRWKARLIPELFFTERWKIAATKKSEIDYVAESGTGRDAVVSSETDGCPVRETLVAPFSRNARSIFRSHVHSYDRRQVAPLHSIKLKVELPQIIHENEITERKSSVDRSFAIRKNERADLCRIQKSFKRSITEHGIVNYLVASRFNENISRWRKR